MHKLILALFLLGLGGLAVAVEPATLSVSAAWVREAPPGAGMTAAFLRLNNSGTHAVKLVAAASPAAGSVELHGHSHENGVMQMRAVPAVTIPAGGSVALEPGGLHLMVFELKTSPKAGEQFPLVLTFDDGSTLPVSADVRSPLQ